MRSTDSGRIGWMRKGLSAVAFSVLLLTLPLGAGAQQCAGDCNGDGEVTIDELVLAVNIALGNRQVGDCLAVDLNLDFEVTIDELVSAVNAALFGCPATPTASAHRVDHPDAHGDGHGADTDGDDRRAGPRGLEVGHHRRLRRRRHRRDGRTPTTARSRSSAPPTTRDRPGDHGRRPARSSSTPTVDRVRRQPRRCDGGRNRRHAATPGAQVSATVEVGSEPTGLALSPTGARLFVAEYAEGRGR